MKEVTQLMINDFKIKQLGYDFMGYKLQRNDILTYHHLIIPRRNGGKITYDNGAIIQRIPHDYLHIIENVDRELFYYITSEMIDINIKGRLDVKNLKNISLLLKEFESKHLGDVTSKGKLLIKPEYIDNRIKWCY